MPEAPQPLAQVDREQADIDSEEQGLGPREAGSAADQELTRQVQEAAAVGALCRLGQGSLAQVGRSSWFVGEVHLVVGSFSVARIAARTQHAGAALARHGGDGSISFGRAISTCASQI